ncbi:hypothetical protein C1E23_19115 [Pseudoalteromonas phenolica]|uniref:Peptidase M4 C-terminal domain-containing protein n=1 Tax=Pseudoalteromonas phenolica TaxID=161398 RepID=A0A4Q7IJY2_9GAMM|nr:M4 family metallopeptidase [Pseudoalteromonas phenolica]RZQ51536.1 hypothetical protein C1E23_19115 [Pseudoalteromonas phenolica]
MKDHLKLTSLLLFLTAPLKATEHTYSAVPAMMGNAKMGLLCAQAPEFASRDCQTTVIPDNGRTRALFPYIPEQYNLLYRDEDSRLFSQFSGYPFVVKHQDGVCSLENAAVVTRQNTVDYPVYSYTCDGAAQESADLSRVQVNYIGAGVFQTENDAHFYGGITMDILHKEFAAMYPNTTVPCDSEAEYCLEQLNVVVNGSSEPYSSAWKDGRVLLGRGIIGSGGFSHATSLDIIAHETGHALLTWNSIIGYENNDTAAIQEAFADLTAVLVRNEFYKKLQAGGEQNFIESDAHQQLSTDGNFYYAMAWDKYVQNRALRYLYSPMTDGKSIDDWRDIEIETPGPHYQAGILNRFFYRLSTSKEWNISKTYRLTMKAAQSCFVEDTTFEHAAFCFIDVAEEQDKGMVSAKLQEVGLIPTNTLANNLDFSIERIYTSINYALAESEQADLSAVNINLNEQPLYQWQSHFNTQSQFNAIKQAQLSLDSGEHLLSITTSNTNGETKTGHRLLSVFAEPWCQPETGSVLSSQFSVNGEDFALDQGYALLAAQNIWYQQSLGEFQLHNMPADKVVSVFYDLNRDRQFTDDENVLSTTEYNSAVTLPNVDAVPGDMLVRFRIDDSSVSACTENELSQSFDLKVHIEAGVPTTPIDFSHKQVEQTLLLTVLPSYNEQAMFRWILPEQVIEQRETELEQAVNAQGAYTISLEHVVSDRVLSRAEKQIELIADPNLTITCEAQGTQCTLSASHDAQQAGVEYRWILAGEQLVKQDNQPFNYDFAGYGEFDVSLAMAYIDGTAEFSVQTKVLLSEPLPDLSLVIGKQVNSAITLSANSEFDNRYTLNWFIGGELQSSHEKEIAYEFTAAQMVTLQLLKAGEVVKETSQLVTPISDPNLLIQCELSGTQCELSVAHNLADIGLTYQWVLNGESIDKASMDTFNYDFAGYGEFTISLTLLVPDSNAEFTTSRVIQIQEPEPLPDVSFNISQVNNTFTFALSSALPAGFEITVVIDGQEYVLEDGQLQIELLSDASSFVYMLKKEGQIVEQQTRDLQREVVPNLDFVCVADGLSCQLSASHNADVQVEEYLWSTTAMQQPVQTSEPNYIMQFSEAGEYAVLLTIVTESGARFTKQKVVVVAEQPYANVDISFSQHNASLKLSTTNADQLGEQYQFIWLLNDKQITAKQLETELATLATDYTVKLQVLMAGKLVKEVSQTIYVYEDIGLDFTWQSNTEQPLRFSFKSL